MSMKKKLVKILTPLMMLPLMVVLGGCITAKDQPFQLTISTGKLQGHTLSQSDDVVAFVGVPYALPPVGNQRWTSPQAPKNWSGTLKAQNQPPACMQQITDPGKSSYTALSQSEDCLYLNVFTPADALQTNKRLPVLFMIHGGGRARSAASRIKADIAALNRRGIVVVTPQYRLGIFSFFAHPELSAESAHGVSGNYGMQDLLQALKWVQTNISQFGGDPTSVTILGPSGGGTATGVLLATPLSKGLFHRAAPLCSNAGITRMHHLKQRYLDQHSAEQLGVRFAKRLGANSLKELRAFSALKIQQHILQSNTDTYSPASGAGDVFDGWMFPQPIMALHKSGKRNDVPVLLGFNADEVSLFNFAGLIDDIPTSATEYENTVTKQYGKLGERLLQQYPSDKPIESIYKLARDKVVSYGSETVARYSHKVTSPTYLYYMAHRPADANELVQDTTITKGVAHCTDDKYFFNWYPRADNDAKRIETDQNMSDYLVNFIKTGNPNQLGLARWQAYDPSSKNYLRFEAGEVYPSSHLLPGMWELHESIRLRDENLGQFRQWLGGWASEDALLRHRRKSE